jgi:alginate O-acetyltransferase complex protein AlgI
VLFNSYEFLFFFFPAVLLGFFVIGRQQPAWAAAFLALASVFFYAWWSIKALPLMLGSIGFNYLMGHLIAPDALAMAASDTKIKRMLMQFAVAVNLLVLGAFKYADFFMVNLNAVFAAFGQTPWAALNWILPIGISFYTFTQIAYLVDSWRGKVLERRFTHYLLFVTYFPHLIAGPILHHAQMMPQFARARTYWLNPRRLVLGLGLFVFGLSKKLLIADPLGQCADLIFHRVDGGLAPSPELAWTAVLAYTLQIYFDFSGYSDMAVGLSRCLGVRLPENFRSPYRSTSIIEFWRHWHMSLSTFLRDYIYIPLGGNRAGESRRLVNLMITMLLGGLWHGAAWTFVIWGAIHGGALVINYLWRRAWSASRRPSPAASMQERSAASRVIGLTAGWLCTMFMVCAAWVMFRAPSLDAATSIYLGLLNLNGQGHMSLNDLSPPFKLHDFYRTLLIALLIALCMPRSRQLVAVWLPVPRRWARALPAARLRMLALGGGLAAGLILGWNVSRLGQHSPFLYFQF